MKNEMFEVVIKKSYADKYGHVNYKKYLDLFRRGQNDFAKKRRLSFSEIEKTYGLRSVVRQMNAEYIGEVFPSEKVLINTKIRKIGNSSFTYHQEILREGKMVTRFDLTIVMIDRNGKPTTIPTDIRTKLQ